MGRFSWIIQWALNATGKVLIRGRQREMGQQNQDTVLLPLKTEKETCGQATLAMQLQKRERRGHRCSSGASPRASEGVLPP